MTDEDPWVDDPLADRDLPLASVRVLDLSRVLAGPFATQALADLGADVVKVERTGVGDETRRWGPPFFGDDAAYFFSVNRNRRAVELDLASESGAARVRRLAHAADIVFENFQPHQAAALGLDDLRRECRDTVWVSIRAASAGGPLGNQPGFDAMMQARSGLMSVTGFDAGQPTKVGVPIVDIVTGLYATHAALAALLAHREHPERPAAHVEVPLLECAVSVLTNQAANYLLAGDVPVPRGNDHPSIAPYGPFATGDRPLMIGAGTDGQFQALCAAIGRPELAADPAFATNAARVRNRRDLVVALEATLTTGTAHDWSEVLAAAGVPHAPINRVDEALREPQIADGDLLQSVATPHGPATLVSCPVTLDGVRPRVRRAPPRLGEHNAEVLDGPADAGSPAPDSRTDER